MAMEEDKEEGVDKAVSAAIRSAKKAARPSKIGHSSTKLLSPSKAHSSKQARSGGKKGKGAFDNDFGSRGSGNNHEGVRAVKGTKPNLDKRLGGKKTGKK